MMISRLNLVLITTLTFVVMGAVAVGEEKYAVKEGYLVGRGVANPQDLSGATVLKAGGQAIMPKSHIETFERYCFECHDSFSEEGGVNLEDLSYEISKDVITAERWQKVLNVINSGEMPPRKKKQMLAPEKAKFLEDLSQQMVVARSILSDTGGVVTMRRLNLREYSNTMEDLLGFKPEVEGLPDDQTGGFDTSGASLYFSSGQFELYRKIAEQNLLKLFQFGAAPKVMKKRSEAEVKHNKRYKEDLEKFTEAYNRATAGLASSEEDFAKSGFKDRAGAKKAIHTYEFEAAQLEQYITRQEVKDGASLIHRRTGALAVKSERVQNRAGGRYILRVRLGAYENAPLEKRYIQYGVELDSKSVLLGERLVEASLEAPEIIEIEIDSLPPSNQVLFYIKQRNHNDRAAMWKHYVDLRKENNIGPDPNLWVDWIEFEGPFHEEWPPAALENILPEYHSKKADARYARKVIGQFAENVFRGQPVNEEFLDRLVDRFREKYKEYKNFHNAIVDPLAIVLASPSFIYLAEEDDQSVKKNTLNNNELAVRLAYFLWSASPDEELVGLAKEGRLLDDTVLHEQTERMLRDPKARRFIEGFTHQWLDMKRLDMFQYNGYYYPNFDESVRQNAREEIYSTIEYLLKENLPINELLKSNFVVINGFLANYYGIDGVDGPHFRKVNLPEGSPRGGLLGTAAVHIMGADGAKSSPVERGVWVLRHLMDDAPPPAPANVPQLSRLSEEKLSPRDLQQLHMEQPQCANCHYKIDPIGFGLENFDATGIWRDQVVDRKKVNGNWQNTTKDIYPVEAHGTLPNGVAFQSYFELRDAIATHYDEAFAKSLTKYLLSYGLGRPFGFSDELIAEKIKTEALSKGGDIASFVHGVVHSEAFKTK